MYLKGLMISQFLVLLVVRNSLADCVPCALLNGCPELNCLGEKVLGMCGCCYVCAKQLGESCGGLYGLIGTCDQGLRCVLPLQQIMLTQHLVHQTRAKGVSFVSRLLFTSASLIFMGCI
ncbi:cysteine-rich motor neuron 1 protein-like isoform X1 [Tachysurus ichikawai]